MLCRWTAPASRWQIARFSYILYISLHSDCGVPPHAAIAGQAGSMKNKAAPAVIVLAVVAVLLVVGGLYYKYVGPGANTKSQVASPFGLPTGPDAFSKPLPTQSTGRNAITGEALDPATHNAAPIAPLAPPPGAGK